MAKFKFGDRVKHPYLGECVVINGVDDCYYVMNEKAVTAYQPLQHSLKQSHTPTRCV